MNLYATVPTLRSRLGISGTASDATIQAVLDAASRYVDALTGRYFYTRTATIDHDTGPSTEMLLVRDDLLSVSSVTMDSEADGTFDGETWTEGTDFVLTPYEGFPKWGLRVCSWGSYALAKNQANYARLVGVWGYGDGESDAPWDTTDTNATVADATTETLVLSVADDVERGHTILVGSEQMFVEAVVEGDETVTATVKRGVNGTTAASHSAASVATASYPSRIAEATTAFASRFYHQLGAEEFYSEGIGDYRYTRFATETLKQRDTLLVSGFQRRRVA